MAKGSKPIPPEVKRARKIKRWLRRLAILMILIAAYFWLLPLVAPSYAPSVAQTRDKLILSAGEIQEKAGTILGVATQIAQTVTGQENAAKTAEDLVRNKVAELTSKLKTLPQEQAKKVKREFCADVVAEQEPADGNIPSPQP